MSVLERLQDWALDTSPSCPPVYWLSGMAGTGKTTIAYSICKYLDEVEPRLLGASFFCSRQIPELRERKYIIPSLAYQLARRSIHFADEVSSIQIDRLDVSSKHIAELLELPWKRSISKQPLVIVIDALDEIEDNDGSQVLEGILKAMSSPDMDGVKFLVTSRPEPRIREVCGDLLNMYTVSRPEPHYGEECGGFQSIRASRLEEISPQESIKDILKSIKASLPTLVPDHGRKLEELSLLSGGLYIYAATAVRFICAPQASGRLSLLQQRNRLDAILSGQNTLPLQGRETLLLDLLYKQILEEVFVNDGEDTVTFRRRVLYTIICTQQPLSTASLAALIARMDTPPTEVDLEATETAIGALHSVLYVSVNDRLVYTYHKSFPDFLSDVDRAGKEFAYSSDVWNLNVGQSCLAVIIDSLQFNIMNWPSSYLNWYEMDYPQDFSKSLLGNVPALIYAITAWVTHFQVLLIPYDSERRDIANLYVKTFLESKTFLLWLEALEGFRVFLDYVSCMRSLQVLLSTLR